MHVPDTAPAYHLVLLGPPGVGKGTQAELLEQQLRACHLSTGDLFRDAACQANPSPAMTAALAAMRRGELVPDEIVMEMVRERQGCLMCKGGFLLDGVPRTVHQAESLEAILRELGIDLDAVLSYEMPLEQIVERLSGRRTCSQCKAVYHVLSRPPAREGICDQCGGTLVQRDDDRPEAVRVRMRTYLEATRPLQDFYAARNKLLTIAAEGTPEAVFAQTMERLSRHCQKSSQN